MLRTLPDEKLAEEHLTIEVKPHIIAQTPDFPLLSLSDRQFELLAHDLLQAAAGDAMGYDRVSLVAEGADRGRDILLLRNGSVVGVAQCKRYKSPLGIGKILTELLKFALFAVRDPDLVPPSPSPLQYLLCTASGLTEAAREFFDSAELARTTIANRAAEYADRARGNIASLKPETEQEGAAEVNDAIRLLSNVDLKHFGPLSIGPSLILNPQIRRWFFRSPEDGPPRPHVAEISSLVEALRSEQLAELEATGRAGATPYVQREGLTEAFDEFLAAEARVFVLVGGSGQGKTSWAARLMERPPARYSVALIKAGEITATDVVATETIGRSLLARPTSGVPTYDLNQAVWDWLDADNRILIVDGVDRARADVRETIAS